MLKNTPMKLLAITLALTLFGGCLDSDGTPVGVDDIEDNSDDNFGPDILKDDVNPTEPKAREQTDQNRVTGNDLTPAPRDRVTKGSALNTAPQRTDLPTGFDSRVPAADITPQR